MSRPKGSIITPGAVASNWRYFQTKGHNAAPVFKMATTFTAPSAVRVQVQARRTSVRVSAAPADSRRAALGALFTGAHHNLTSRAAVGGRRKWSALSVRRRTLLAARKRPTPRRTLRTPPLPRAVPALETRPLRGAGTRPGHPTPFASRGTNRGRRSISFRRCRARQRVLGRQGRGDRRLREGCFREEPVPGGGEGVRGEGRFRRRCGGVRGPHRRGERRG